MPNDWVDYLLMGLGWSIVAVIFGVALILVAIAERIAR